MKTFPKFASHDEASCFNCGGDFGPDPYWFDSGNAPGHGQFALACEKCRTTTFYDLDRQARHRVLERIARHVVGRRVY